MSLSRPTTQGGSTTTGFGNRMAQSFHLPVSADRPDVILHGILAPRFSPAHVSRRDLGTHPHAGPEPTRKWVRGVQRDGGSHLSPQRKIDRAAPRAYTEHVSPAARGAVAPSANGRKERPLWNSQ